MALTREQVDRLCAMAESGWSTKEIAAALGVTRNQARYQLRKLSLSNRARRRPSRWTVEWAEAIIRGEVALPRGSWRTKKRAEAMVAEAG